MTYSSIFGPFVGRAQVEAHVLDTLSLWIITYIAEYERQNGLRVRSLPVPPTPESIHGGVDFNTFANYQMPELIAVCQPTGEVERHPEAGYGSWFAISVAAHVQVEGDQDATRILADAYGAALQALVTQQGNFGLSADGQAGFTERTRLFAAATTEFPDPDVRDIARSIVVAHSFIPALGDDLQGPRFPPQDPYANPAQWVTAEEITVALIRGTPDTHGVATADEVVVDGTVNPPITRYQQGTVNEP